MVNQDDKDESDKSTSGNKSIYKVIAKIALPAIGC